MPDLGPHAAFIIAAYARDLRRGRGARCSSSSRTTASNAACLPSSSERHQAALGARFIGSRSAETAAKPASEAARMSEA